ncbi:UbiX family flavin prenyltransferase [Bosea sp. 2YAB26]|uniref:UbiX family flavin prenyltransferase n=1 Tax=Bosea sp. 2YAB26 TaxID=3237478 RepID=UPI003F916212
MTNLPERVVVGISGASGAAIGLRVVELLAAARSVEIHLVVSQAAERTLVHEVGPGALERVRGLATHCYNNRNIGATIASGSFRTIGMIVAPCSIRSLSAIAFGQLDNLLVRAADVQLKERRRLVLLVRESPLHLGHLRTMAQVTEIGAIIAPPVPAFYMKPKSLRDVIDHVAGRAIALLGTASGIELAEWGG